MGEPEKIDIQAMIGNLRILADARGYEAPKEEWRDERRERLRGLEIDPLHARLAIEHRECPKIAGHQGSIAAAQAATAFVATLELRLAIIGGPTGRGKTVAATWVASNLDSVLWVSAKDCRVGEAWDQLRKRAAKCGVLVLDDLGQEASEWASSELGSLVESRFDKGLRTLATTNLPMAALGKRYSDRFLSRLSQNRLSLYATCGGSDLRREHE